MPAVTARRHPLAPYRDRIDPEGQYTVRAIAGLLEMHVSAVSGMAVHGWLPGAKVVAHARGGRMWTWSGRHLLQIAGRPLRLRFDAAEHERYDPLTLYRVGCRCGACTAAHTGYDRERRRALADAAFTQAKREQLLTLIGRGSAAADAADAVGVTLGQVHGRAAWDPDFSEALDKAGWALCVLGSTHHQCGTAAAYSGNESSRSNPRPRCRGTGCRQWRRGTSEAEKARPRTDG